MDFFNKFIQYIGYSEVGEWKLDLAVKHPECLLVS